MADEKKEAQYAPPASQVDLEERLKNGNVSSRVLSTSDDYKPAEDDGGRDYRVEGNKVDEYVAVSPEYATYANKTEAPLATPEENPESEVFKSFAEGLNPQVPEGWEPEDKEPEVTTEGADSPEDETPDGDPVPQSATTSSAPAKKAASAKS